MNCSIFVYFCVDRIGRLFVNSKSGIMKKLLLICVALMAQLATVEAQNIQKQSFERYNQWMLSGRYVAPLGVGVEAVYGRHFNQILFLGVGFGFDAVFNYVGKSTVGWTDKDGNWHYEEHGPWQTLTHVPVYADLQLNFSRKPAPFFAEMKLGAGIGRFDFDGWCLQAGLAIGKRFMLKNNHLLNAKIGVDCAIGPWYAYQPLYLSVGYQF